MGQRSGGLLCRCIPVGRTLAPCIPKQKKPAHFRRKISTRCSSFWPGDLFGVAFSFALAVFVNYFLLQLARHFRVMIEFLGVDAASAGQGPELAGVAVEIA